MYILAVETSSPQGSAALGELREGHDRALIVDEIKWFRESSHSEVLTPNVKQLLALNKVTLAQLSSIAVGLGPGSFTGVRVGLNFARGLGYALDIPLMGFDSLEILAHSPEALKSPIPVICMNNAFKNQLYVASYLKSECLFPPTSLQAFDLHKVLKGQQHLCLGDGYSLFKNQFEAELLGLLITQNEVPHYPEASTLVQLASKKGTPQPWATIKPLYIRASEAEEKLKMGLLKPLPKL